MQCDTPILSIAVFGRHDSTPLGDPLAHDLCRSAMSIPINHQRILHTTHPGRSQLRTRPFSQNYPMIIQLSHDYPMSIQ